MDPELQRAVDLCLPDGTLAPAARGWSRRPLHRCRIPGRWGRRKQWHHWVVADARTLVAMTFADLDYFGLVAVWCLELPGGRSVERLGVRPFGWWTTPPELADEGLVSASAQGLRLRFADAGYGVRLDVDAPDVHARFEVTRPPAHESLGVVVPWDARHFAYTSKQNALPASGWIDAFGARRELSGAWASLDYGRGVWPARTRWNWASGAGDGIGLNLGAGWTDGTGATENALCLNGRLERPPGDVVFQREPSGRWTIRGPEVEVELEPCATKRLPLPRLVHDVGRLRGRVLGHAIDVLGWAEAFETLW